MKKTNQDPDLSYFTIFFSPASCRISIRFYQHESGRLFYDAIVVRGQHADRFDFVVENRNREHMISQLKDAFGNSRKQLMNNFLDKLEVLA